MTSPLDEVTALSTPAATELFEQCRPLGEAFATAGYRLYIVGGSVRDLLLGDTSVEPDLDFTTDALPSESKRLLAPLAQSLWTQGERFGTIAAHVDDRLVEVTTHRAESYEPDSRKPNVAYSTEVAVDLGRRDFTINALAIEVTQPEPALIDPFHGLADLCARRLATPLSPEESFSDDPLRMMRAARFVARFDLVAQRELVDAVESMHHRLSVVSVERIRDEFEKLLSLRDPQRGLAFLIDHSLADGFVPELTESVLGRIDWSLLRRDPHVRLAAILAVDPRVDATARLRRLRHSKTTVQRVGGVVRGVRTLIDHAGPWSAGDVRRFVAGRFDLVGDIVEVAGALGAAGATELDSAIRELSVRENLAEMSIPIDGRGVMEDLGLAAGRQVGDALAHLTAHRLEVGPFDRAEATEVLSEWLARRSE